MPVGRQRLRQSVAVRKYLNAHAEPEAKIVSSCPGEWEHALVIPACDEGESLSDVLRDYFRVEASGRRLAVVVVNGRRDAEERVHEQNQETLRALLEPSPHWSEGGISCVSRGGGGDLLVVDRASIERRLPPKEGVGLARKIGSDIALALWSAGKVRGEWLVSTDADVRLPGDYLTRLASLSPSAAAAVFPFRHSEPSPALILYEISLHYYVLGLREAGSPYAFHTIGSALGFRFPAYAEVRGVPRRQAGEDFYLLNKLAKVGGVELAGGEPLSILDRPSARVPFGTGPAVRKIGETLAVGDSYLMYHPECFAALGRLQAALGTSADSGKEDALKRLFATDEALGRAFGGLRLQKNISAILKHPDAKWRRSSMFELFDGFRTLKLIHALRDGGLSSLPWREALVAAPFIEVGTEEPLELLHRLRERCFGLP